MNNSQIERGHNCTGCWNSFPTDYQLAYHIEYGCPANVQPDSSQGQAQTSMETQVSDLANLSLEMARHEREGIPATQQPAEPDPTRSLQVIRCPSCRVQFATSAYHLQQVTECPSCHWRFATSQHIDANPSTADNNVGNFSGNQQLSVQQGGSGLQAAPSYTAPQAWTCPVCQQQFPTAAQCNDHIQEHLRNLIA